MSPELDALLARWRDDALAPGDIERLIDLLRADRARADAVGGLRFDHALGEALALERARANAPAMGDDTRRIVRMRPQRVAWRRRAWMAAAACLCVLIGGAVWSSTRAPWARIEASAESTLVARAGHASAAVVGQALLSGDAIVGSATVEFRDGTRIEIGADAEATVDDVGGAKHARVERGTVQAAVAKQPEHLPLTFETQDAVATVVGTRLTVVVADGVTRLAVADGTVSFHDRALGTDMLVHAGGSASTAKPAQDAPAPARLIVMSWNVKDAERGSVAQQARLIADAGADVVSLQQVLSRDRASYLSELERLTASK